MSAPTTARGLSAQARNLRWLLANLVDEVPGVRSVAVVSSDGLLLLSSDPARPDATEGTGATAANGATAETDAAAPAADGGRPRPPVRGADGGRRGGPRTSGADLATIISGLASLTQGAAKLTDAGAVRQTMITMDEGSLFVMAISDGSLLGVHAEPDCDMSVVAYHMALFVGRAGHVLTPELRTELRTSMELDQ
ncbi:roadblock/LC7 domain-containing protein [Streptomyces sp. TRM 70361]|uniref:roadblock/LC7 domain-containing protein n=1 Tax=Streptomyces sp. TRM 70361 TaxID=3116553 RepID=UPI002E7C2223|nr:roadblock/LC7 domain-containing protein [Streptomyces sp. TRM 70361]MEE1938803.1 roadblock/LC7 domain-containing protein [Streptomyces sp. TRM 70361]